MELFLTRFIPTKKFYASVDWEGCVFELGYSGYALWVRYNLYISAKTCLVVRAFYWRLFGEHVCPPSQRYVIFGYFNECNIAMESSLFVNELVCRHLYICIYLYLESNSPLLLLKKRPVNRVIQEWKKNLTNRWQIHNSSRYIHIYILLYSYHHILYSQCSKQYPQMLHGTGIFTYIWLKFVVFM